MNDARTRQADALIEGLQREHRGKLTVFLGAAPGVGKTYAMLTRARAQLKHGVDVVAGVVETHGRGETAALLEGIPRHPMLAVTYQNRRLQELDLDALLQRRPALALVDELAHRNVPGSRHERRWQDVIELLDAGIDVYTTINIQHLESLNDVVLRITGVRVSETVPDAVFDRLHDIILVDLPPRELIERLQQGKVYLPEQATQALQAFFSPANLTALRELAMQEAAERVDNALRESDAARGQVGVPLRRRVLVAIDGAGQSEYMVRVARRLAERRGAPWTVVTVQRRAYGEATQQEIDRAFALARRLGGDTALLHGPGIADLLLDYAGQNGVATLVLGRTRERPLARMFNRTLTQQLIQRGAHLEINIVSTPVERARARRAALQHASSRLRTNDAALSVFATLCAIGVSWSTERWLGLDDLSMIFIVAVLMVAARTRMAAAMLTAALCFIAYNFFFIEPRFTFHITARQGVVTVFMFLAAALVAGRLASRLRMQVLALRAANRHANALQELGRQLSSAADLGQVLGAGRKVMAHALDARIWMRAGQAVAGEDEVLSATDLAAADWAQRHGQVSGRHTDTLAAASWSFLPMLGEKGPVGVVGLRAEAGDQPQNFEQRRLAEAMVEDIAQAAQRTRLVADLEQARMSGETERLRSALLSSVSHDLRSPLAAMIGSASSLTGYAASMPAEDRRALLDTILTEGERLDRYIQNLLDMTRLGHEGLSLNRDWIGADELIGSAARRLQRYQPEAKLRIHIAPELPALWVHPALVEQAVFNVMENAVKFSPLQAAVEVDVRQVQGGLRIDVCDAGPGIPEAERARIFDMFYSVERGDRGRHGTGLGLTICQGMIGAHGGSVEALPGRDGRGTLIRMTLPLLNPMPEDEVDDGQ
jgi:two-component system sensor histidine kinase KdpD